MTQEQAWLQGEGRKGLISVIIPTHNRASLLEETVKSVVGQTIRPIECIVVDDGSTDNTEEIVRALSTQAGQGIEIRFIRQDRQGPAAARNRGTREAKGEYIQYLDSDDLLEAGKIADQVQFLQSHPEYGGVYGDWRTGAPSRSQPVKARHHTDMIAQLLGVHVIQPFSLLMTRATVARIGPWDESLAIMEEVDFHLRGLLEGERYAYVAQSTGLYRSHDGERVANMAKIGEHLAFLDKWEALLKVKGMLNERRLLLLAQAYLCLAQECVCDDKALCHTIVQHVMSVCPSAVVGGWKRRLPAMILGPEKAFMMVAWLSQWRMGSTNRGTNASRAGSAHTWPKKIPFPDETHTTLPDSHESGSCSPER